ncbi:unnamed protein product [Sphagnum jensenii]|uniref:Uncharacterized protein n=1 Tax=Sphagnum jensenii TaxID=128206 RepID=A0ABP0VIK0_9BRYO
MGQLKSLGLRFFRTLSPCPRRSPSPLYFSFPRVSRFCDRLSSALSTTLLFRVVVVSLALLSRVALIQSVAA